MEQIQHKGHLGAVRRSTRGGPFLGGQPGTTTSEAQVGDLSDSEGGAIRAFRFGLVGTFNFKRPWFYTVFAATHTFDKGFDSDTDDDLSWPDYRLDIPMPADPDFKHRQAEGTDLAGAADVADISALAGAQLAGRRSAVGPVIMVVALSGTVAGDWVSWSVGGRSTTGSDADTSFSDTSSQLVGRVTWVPLVSEDESNLFHLGFGLRHSNAKQPARARKTTGVQQRAAVRRYGSCVGGRRHDVQAWKLTGARARTWSASSTSVPT